MDKTSNTPDHNRGDLPRAVVALTLTVIGIAYIACAARHILGGDNAEFVSLFAKGGVAHPSGYPLYILILRLFSWVPAQSAAHGASLVTVIISVASVAMLYKAARAWGASRFSSTVAMALYAFSSLAWKLGSHAEVFSLNTLIAGAIVAVSSPNIQLKPLAKTALLGGLAGLGLSNHLTIVLLAPVGLSAFFAALIQCSSIKERFIATTIAIPALLAGLLPYLSLPWFASDPLLWTWGDPSTLNGIIHHFLRSDYGTFSLGLTGTQVPWWQYVAALTRHLLADLMWVFPFIALLGMGVSVVSKRKPNFMAIALVATFVLAGPFFVSNFNLGLEGIQKSAVERFFLLPQYLLCIFVALGVNSTAKKVSRFRPMMAVIVLTLVCTTSVLVSAKHVQKHRNSILESYIVDSLQSASPNAVILGTGDHRLFSFYWAKEVEHIRDDVQFVDPIMLLHSWYRQRVSKQLGIEIAPPKNNSINTAILAKQILDSGRPLFLTNLFTFTIVQTYPSYPQGTLIRVLPTGQMLPSPTAIEKTNLELYKKFKMSGYATDDPSDWAYIVLENYARPWQTLSNAFKSLGQTQKAKQNLNRARVFMASPLDKSLPDATN